MSEIIHTQGLWEIVPSSAADRFDIITSASDEPICLAAKHEDAALLVFAHLMFTTLCFWANDVESGKDKEALAKLGAITRAILKKANGTGEIRYGAINMENEA